MASIFQKTFDKFKQNAESGNPAYTTSITAQTPTFKAPDAPATLNVTAPTSQSSTSRTLTNNSIDDFIKQINDINTSVDTSAQENFDINKYLGGAKQGLQNLNGGQIQSGDVSKFTNMRPENEYEAGIGRGLDKIEQFTDPNSDVYKTMFNRALDRFDSTAAATNMSQSMRIANNSNLSDSAKRVAGAELNRVTQSNRAELTGDLTEQVNNMMFDAAKEFTTQSINAADYEEGKFKTDADLAMREMTNRISTLQIEGNLSITEANLAYQQIADTIYNKHKDVTNQLEKLSLLSTTAEQSQDYKLRAEQAYVEMFDFWAEKSVNSIIEMKNSNNGEISIDQIKNDPRTMSYLMKEMEMNGYDGNVNDYIQSRIDASKTQTQVNQEAVDALKRSFISSGMSPERADKISKLFQQAKNGAIENDDGSWFVPGADGSPLCTFKEEPDGTIKRVKGDGIERDDNGKEIPTQVGETYTKDGLLYQVTADGNKEIPEGGFLTDSGILYRNVAGEKIPVTTPADIWGPDSESILESAKDSKVYSDIVAKRKASITSGEVPATDIMSDPNKLALAKEEAKPITLTSRYDEGIKKRIFTSAVPKENTPFIYNGQTYIASSSVYSENKDGSKKRKEEKIKAINVDTGKEIIIGAYKLENEKESTIKFSGKSDIFNSRFKVT